MPAARSVPRYGSRQPQPYPSNGGPADPILVLPEGVDDPPPPKPVVERSPKHHSKQKQKQKARVRAPLPPDNDIIEISSDEDEPPLVSRKPSGSMKSHERRIKELEEETKALKAALVVAKAAPPLAVKAQPSPASDLNYTKLLSTIEDEITCEVCALKMWYPFTLACGHTFCKSCLQDWFSTTLMQHLNIHPTYDPQRVIPTNMRNALARNNLSAPDRRAMERDVVIRISLIEHPQYSCPTCRVVARAAPAENFVVKHLVRTIAGVQGELPPKDPIGRDAPFDGFFPFSAFMR